MQYFSYEERFRSSVSPPVPSTLPGTECKSHWHPNRCSCIGPGSPSAVDLIYYILPGNNPHRPFSHAYARAGSQGAAFRQERTACVTGQGSQTGAGRYKPCQTQGAQNTQCSLRMLSFASYSRGSLIRVADRIQLEVDKPAVRLKLVGPGPVIESHSPAEFYALIVFHSPVKDGNIACRLSFLILG